MKASDLFWRRFRDEQRTSAKYLRLLFNDHFVIFLIIALGGIVLAYRELLSTPQSMMFWRSNWWQVIIITWLLIGLQIGDLITYFKPADRLYLLGNDSEIIKKYLTRSVNLSILYASVWQAVFVGTIIPILLRIYVSGLLRISSLLIFAISYKLLLLLFERDKLFLKQRVQTITIFEANSTAEGLLFRVLLPSIFLEFILILTQTQVYILMSAWLVLMVVTAYYFHISNHKANSFAINWAIATQQAQQQKQRVLHFFALFAEIPNQPKSIKRRRYLDFCLQRLIKNKPAMLRLYWTRLARDTEILPLVLRLIIVGMIIVGVLQTAPDWLVAVVGALTVYLVNFQLLPLFSDTQKKIWTRLMPITNSQKQSAFIQVHRLVNYIVCTLLIVTVAVTSGSLQRILLLFVLLIVVTIALQKSYIPYMIKKMKK